jgi:hypothetical protein
VFGLGMAAAAYGEGRIAQREENQQKRIGQGVSSGSLTAGETAHVEKQESNLNKEIQSDRKANGGNLTNKEKAPINRQQNHLSQEIYVDKHNDRHPQP